MVRDDPRPLGPLLFFLSKGGNSSIVRPPPFCLVVNLRLIHFPSFDSPQDSGLLPPPRESGQSPTKRLFHYEVESGLQLSVGCLCVPFPSSEGVPHTPPEKHSIFHGHTDVKGLPVLHHIRFPLSGVSSPVRLSPLTLIPSSDSGILVIPRRLPKFRSSPYKVVRTRFLLDRRFSSQHISSPSPTTLRQFHQDNPLVLPHLIPPLFSLPLSFKESYFSCFCSFLEPSCFEQAKSGSLGSYRCRSTSKVSESCLVFLPRLRDCLFCILGTLS